MAVQRVEQDHHDVLRGDRRRRFLGHGVNVAYDS
jgi:hypothetical protein